MKTAKIFATSMLLSLCLWHLFVVAYDHKASRMTVFLAGALGSAGLVYLSYKAYQSTEE